MEFGKNRTGISKNLVNSSKHVCFDLDKHFSTCGTHQNITVVFERKFERNSMKKYKTDWPKNIMKSRFSVVLGKLDNIESLLKKHIIFVLLCFAQISQTLHVCGATMKFAYIFARNSGRRFTWVVCEIRSKHIRKIFWIEYK